MVPFGRIRVPRTVSLWWSLRSLSFDSICQGMTESNRSHNRIRDWDRSARLWVDSILDSAPTLPHYRVPFARFGSEKNCFRWFAVRRRAFVWWLDRVLKRILWNRKLLQGPTDKWNTVRTNHRPSLAQDLTSFTWFIPLSVRKTEIVNREYNAFAPNPLSSTPAISVSIQFLVEWENYYNLTMCADNVWQTYFLRK